MAQHIFFKEFQRNKRENKLTKEDKKYRFNCMLCELVSNWTAVVELIYKYKHNLLGKILQVEADWINFIVKNQIDITNYVEDPDNFLNVHLKKITA